MKLPMKRSDFLKFVSLNAAALTIPGCIYRRSWSVTFIDRPNILLCLSDNQSWLHAGAYGDKVVKTPAFDRLAWEGVLFNRAFVSAPSCCPSRGNLLTGQSFYRLREGAQNWSILDRSFKVYPDILEAAGYHVGYTGKGWGPGDWKKGGWARNPAGPEYNQRQQQPVEGLMREDDYAGNFEDFLRARPKGQPFCFWYGGKEPHRPYQEGSGLSAGKKLENVVVPPFLPDTEVVRSDLLDYARAIDWFDTHLGRMIQLLEKVGELDNTIIVMTSDNGMQFPRGGIANLYDYGTRVPLVVRWGAKTKGGRVVDDFISLTDFAPTFLEAAGITPPPEMNGRSFLHVLLSNRFGQEDPTRDHVIIGRERHHPQAFFSGGLSFPCRGIRTQKYLYIRNYRPGRSCAGDAPAYNDVDPGPTKTYMLTHRDSAENQRLFELAFGSRPAEELYDLQKDPDQMYNIATDPEYANVKEELAERLYRELLETLDPRALGEGDVFDEYPIYWPEQIRIDWEKSNKITW